MESRASDINWNKIAELERKAKHPTRVDKLWRRLDKMSLANFTVREFRSLMRFFRYDQSVGSGERDVPVLEAVVKRHIVQKRALRKLQRRMQKP